MVNFQASGNSQTQENWGLFAHQPSTGLPYPTICSTNNTKHKTQICTLVLSQALRASRRCGIGWGVHHGQRHRVHGTPDGAAMVMGADIDVTRWLMSVDDQGRIRWARRQSGHLRQRRSCHGRRCRDGIESGKEVRHVLLRTVIIDRWLLLLVVLCKCVKPLARYGCPPSVRQRTTSVRSELRLPRAVSGKVAQLATPVTRRACTRQRMKHAPPVATPPGSAAVSNDFIVALVVTLRTSGA
jgi:hypothetical protein